MTGELEPEAVKRNTKHAIEWFTAHLDSSRDDDTLSREALVRIVGEDLTIEALFDLLLGMINLTQLSLLQATKSEGKLENRKAKMRAIVSEVALHLERL